MPPTSSPWWKALEALGRVGYTRNTPVRLERIGDPGQQYDAAGSLDWRRHLRSDDLFRLWSPPAVSPWAAYAKPTLFAAMDAYRGPPPGSSPPQAQPSAAGLAPPPAPTSSAPAAPGRTASGAPHHPPGWIPVSGPSPPGTSGAPGAPPSAAQPMPPQPGSWSQLATSAPPAAKPGIGPRCPPGLGGERPNRPPIPPHTAVIVDLPGDVSAAYGAWLARAGFEPVPLWNNWPHPRGLVDMDRVLAALLHFVPWVQRDPARDPKAMPAFLLDRSRLGMRNPVPNEFDNRYFHVDIDLPSAATLRRHGVSQVLYLAPSETVPAVAAAPRAPTHGADQGRPDLEGQGFRMTGTTAPPEPDDLNRPLVDLAKRIPLMLGGASLSDFAIQVRGPWAPGPRKTPFNTVRDPAFLGYKRAAAGGFGRLVPEPSSGGG